MWDWKPPRKYRYVCSGLTIPDGFRNELFDRLVSDYVEPGGRLILRRYYNRNEDRETSFNLGNYLQHRGFDPVSVVMDRDVPMFASIDL